MTTWLRKNVGIIVSSIGLILLIILTFGDMGELFTEQYWINVGGNISSISALSIGLVMIQISIKQGVGEQALSVGLNTKTTQLKYDEHKAVIKKCNDRQIYLPYFLNQKNKRETERRKREFLIDNNFSSEKMLRLSGNKKLIKQYQKIQTNITVDSIKWSTTEIVYNRTGRIEKLEVYRKKRLAKAVITGFIWMFATTLITGGLFLDVADIPFWQKVVKLFTYLITIAMSVVFDIGKNYEKGAFGVPNELDEINSIWEEFYVWDIPKSVINEVDKINKEENLHQLELNQDENAEDDDVSESVLNEDKEEIVYETSEEFITGRDLQEKPEEIESV